MGLTFHSVEHLASPFLAVDEQRYVVTPEKPVTVRNATFKWVLCWSGACRVQIERGALWNFTPGDLLIVPVRCNYRYLSDESAALHALRLVATLDAPRGGDAETDFCAFLGHHFREPCLLAHREARESSLRDVAGRIFYEAQRRRPGYRHRVYALCTEFVVEAARLLHEQNENEANASRVATAQSWMLAHLAETLELRDVARAVDVSPEHLSRSFRRATGQTVFGFLRVARLERAKLYLADSDTLVGEIARLTGWSSATLFARHFKAYVGCSPLVYRRTYRR
jgi:AraC-like DNA-binding protein